MSKPNIAYVGSEKNDFAPQQQQDINGSYHHDLFWYISCRNCSWNAHCYFASSFDLFSPTLFDEYTHKGFVDLFYDFCIQKSHHFYGFWIQNLFCPFLQFLDPETAVFLRFLDPETIYTISGFRNFLVHIYDFWIQKLKYICSFWIQKLHHYCNFWIIKWARENVPPLLLPTNGLGADPHNPHLLRWTFPLELSLGVYHGVTILRLD